MQRLRQSSEHLSADRISFVLAAGQSAARDIDFAKLCDHIEAFPAFDAARVSTLVEAVRTRCLGSFPDVATGDAENPWNPTQYMLLSRFDLIPLPDAAAHLLRTPRALKHALRRTYQSWAVLHGEVDFDHLLATNVLRAGAPEAFDFLRRNWGRLSDDPTTWRHFRHELDPIRSRMTEAWRRVTADVEWDVRAGTAVLEYLLPSAVEYLGERRGTGRPRPQGVGQERYWLRAVNEEIDPAQARDQTVLRDIADWRASPRAASPLIDGLCANDDYVAVWEHFASATFAGSPGRELTLAEHVLDCYRTPRGARIPHADGSTPMIRPVRSEAAFLAVWRRASRTVSKDDVSRDWLERQVRLAVPVNLALVNDLYEYWASVQNGIVCAADRPHVRRVVHEAARAELRSGADVLRVTHPELACGVKHLVFPPDSDAEPSELRGLPHWDWLGPVLLDALRADPPRVVRHVAHLIAVGRRGEYPGIETHELDRQLLTGFFGAAADEVLATIAAVRGQFTGPDREFLEQLTRSAGAAPYGSGMFGGAGCGRVS